MVILNKITWQLKDNNMIHLYYLLRILSLKIFLQPVWAGKNRFKNQNNLMHYFKVILLSDVI